MTWRQNFYIVKSPPWFLNQLKVKGTWFSASWWIFSVRKKSFWCIVTTISWRKIPKKQCAEHSEPNSKYSDRQIWANNFVYILWMHYWEGETFFSVFLHPPSPSVIFFLNGLNLHYSLILIHTFCHWDLVMKKFLRPFSPFRWFKKCSCQLLVKEWPLSTGKLPRRLALEQCG